MTDKTIYWNGATGKRGADDEPARTQADVIAELTSAVIKLSEANEYTRRVIDSLRVRLDRLEGK